ALAAAPRRAIDSAPAARKRARVWAPAPAPPPRPPPPHDFVVHHAAFNADGRRLVTASADGTARLWDLSSDNRPVEDVLQLARLLAGRQLDPTGVMVAIDPAAVTDAWQELSAQFPGRFAPPSAEAQAPWQGREAKVGVAASEWFAAAWFFDRLIEADPTRGPDRVTRGRAHAELSQWDKAAADFAKAVALGADSVPVRYQHALA